MKQIATVTLLAMLVSACSFFGVRSGYEEPRYRVVERLEGQVEIRAYEPRLAIEARVAGEGRKDARSASFRLLFDYISGANRTGASIAMTTPVESVAASEKIAMTVPVETVRVDDDSIYMRFFLPAQYDRQTAPKPLDDRVQIVDVPAQTMAVLRFSGRGGQGAVAKESDALLRSLEGSAWHATSTPVTYFYDPPWTLPLFRRNEVAVTVGCPASVEQDVTTTEPARPVETERVGSSKSGVAPCMEPHAGQGRL